MSYVELHAHSAYSFLDGASQPEELAARTGTDSRYVREWLSNQAAGGYVTYAPEADRFSLSPEQSFALAQREKSRARCSF